MRVASVAQLKPLSDAPGRVVIIGSGAVGLYLASVLAKAGREVVVIEAGQPHLGSFEARSFESIGREHSGVKIGRSRSLGGTTNLWGGQLVEFQAADFDGRAWLPGSKWPVSHAEIKPFYAKAYAHLGIEEQATRDDFIWRGISSKPPNLGADLEVFLTRWMRVPNFAEVFAKQIESDPKIEILIGHTCVGFTSAAGRVRAARVIDERGQAHQIEGDAFVLGAGTVENARLLMNEAADESRPCPWRGNPMLGAWFQDHLGGPIATIVPQNTKAFFNTFCTIVHAGQKYQPKIRWTNEAQGRQRVLNIQGICAFESAASEHLVYLKQFLRAAVFGRKVSGLGDFVRSAIAGARYLPPLMWRYMVDHRVFVPSTSRVLLSVQAEQQVTEKSRITIDTKNRDRYGLARVVLDWRVEGEELASLKTFAEQVDASLRQAGLAKLDIYPDLVAQKPEFLLTLHDTIHQTGGAVMGENDREGVVDKNLRVFGTSNLYVGGASTFRTNSNANVTFTAIAFAHRLGEHLLGAGSEAQARDSSHRLADA